MQQLNKYMCTKTVREVSSAGVGRRGECPDTSSARSGTQYCSTVADAQRTCPLPSMHGARLGAPFSPAPGQDLTYRSTFRHSNINGRSNSQYHHRSCLLSAVTDRQTVFLAECTTSFIYYITEYNNIYGYILL